MTLVPNLQNQVVKKIIDSGKEDQNQFEQEVIQDFWIGHVSRELSLQGRREVLTGKAKFGVFGDGKELPQLAMARVFEKGDYRSGYYRDQTLMLALGVSTVEDFLAQMYSDVHFDPFSGGRQMNCHFATPFIDREGHWIDHTDQYNISSGISCTAGQMGRALGLAFASKKFKELNLGSDYSQFTQDGQEVCFCTIGDGSTSEGVFWETVNAAAVLKVPLVIAVWDDGYGISVPVELQTAKGSISRLLEGFLRDEKGEGIDLYAVDGWDYPSLCVTFDKATKKARKDFIPAVIHVKNLTQPQGHSTSGSHERYKTKERLAWEHESDGLKRMEEWMIYRGIIDESQAQEMKKEARSFVRAKKIQAWQNFIEPHRQSNQDLVAVFSELTDHEEISTLRTELTELVNPTLGDQLRLARQMSYRLMLLNMDVPESLRTFIHRVSQTLEKNYSTHLYSSSDKSALKVPVVEAKYGENAEEINGSQVINSFFDKAFEKYSNLIAFGEDVGHLGDVNQGMADLQKKYGQERVFDTGIREWTIIGQGLGCAMRGLRPIAEIQYIDYLVYALPILTDDLACLRYRSNNQQQAPLIIRTRGHRLEGIWHTGSPMAMILNSLKGIYVCVPRNLTQAAGMYHTLIQSDDPGLVVECLNGYRLKEKLPENLDEFTVPLGIPEILISGTDVTIVTYGSCVRYAMAAASLALKFGIEVELIDVQTLLPFDTEQIIVSSLRKTNRVLFLDEDDPGGTTAYMMQKVLEEQNGYRYLDAKPVTLHAKDHRTAYGSDADYHSKPQVEDIFEAIYEMVFEEPFRL